MIFDAESMETLLRHKNAKQAGSIIIVHDW